MSCCYVCMQCTLMAFSVENSNISYPAIQYNLLFHLRIILVRSMYFHSLPSHSVIHFLNFKSHLHAPHPPLPPPAVVYIVYTNSHSPLYPLTKCYIDILCLSDKIHLKLDLLKILGEHFHSLSQQKKCFFCGGTDLFIIDARQTRPTTLIKHAIYIPNLP